MDKQERDAIRALCEAGKGEILRIHQEMLDITNAFQCGYSPVIGPQQTVDWFNTIKEFWAWDDIQALLDALDGAENERNRAYLVGYEDGRMGVKCGYKKLDA